MIIARDGVRLAVHELGDPAARPLLLLHGFMSSAQVNWIKYGTARRLAEAGYRCIMPDLRGHGKSEAPENAAAYPTDILVRDQHDLIDAMGLHDFDLAGFSLGARTAARLVVDGVAPGRLILAGMGLDGMVHWEQRRSFFVHAIDNAADLKRGDPGWMAVQFMKTTRVSPQAMRHVIMSFDNLDPARLSLILQPTLILSGVDDDDNGSAEPLAEMIDDARLAYVPGNHMSCVTMPDFGEAMLAFLRP